jgi:hypothetical protein
MSDYGNWRISVWDRYGVFLTELECQFNCIWSLNEVGSASFTLSRYDEKLKERYLQFGNHIVFEHAHLGDWGGIILPHDGRGWNGDGTVTFRARSAEFNFNRRRAPLIDGPRGYNWVGMPGSLFKRIVDNMNAKADTRVRIGRVDRIGSLVIMQLRMLVWSKHLEKIIAQTNRRLGGDYWLEPACDVNGRLIFRANYVARRGRTTRFHLQEGVNLETPNGEFFREDGDIVNDMGILASESEGSNYKFGYAVNKTSQGKYGLFEDSDAVTTDSPAQAENMAEEVVAEKAYPRKAYVLTAIETPEQPNTFYFVRPGDEASVHLYSVGFWFNQIGLDEDVRIVSVEYDTEENKAMLTVEEI